MQVTHDNDLGRELDQRRFKEPFAFQSRCTMPLDCQLFVAILSTCRAAYKVQGSTGRG